MQADALYKLLPAIYRIRDSERGRPLQALMQVLGEQGSHLHADIENLYDNWFIETCDDWVVPYLGNLVGFRRGHPIGEPGDSAVSESVEFLRLLYPRREISQLVSLRRRKGTLPVLEDLALNVAGWRAWAAEASWCLAIAWIAQFANLLRGVSVNVSQPGGLARLNTAFDRTLRSVDVRWKPADLLSPLQVPRGLTLSVWRRQPLSVSRVEPRIVESSNGWKLLSFSPFGLDVPLVINAGDGSAIADPAPPCLQPPPEQKPCDAAPPARPLAPDEPEHFDETRYPTFVRRELLRRDLVAKRPRLYGCNKSLNIHGVPAAQVRVCNLTKSGVLSKLSDVNFVYVDPHVGLMAKHVASKTTVSYYHPILARMGGGEYPRAVANHDEYPVYRFLSLPSSRNTWNQFFSTRPQIKSYATQFVVDSSVGFELASSAVYQAPLPNLRIRQNQTLELRAANQTRPVIEFATGCVLRPIRIELEPGARLVVDGITILAARIDIRRVDAEYAPPPDPDCACRTTQIPPAPPTVVFRHSTVAPWVNEFIQVDPGFAPCNHQHDRLQPGKRPRRRPVGCIHLCLPGGRLVVRDSILSSLHVEDTCSTPGSCPRDPVAVQLHNSIVDGLISGATPDQPAFASLDCGRSTVLGTTNVHQIDGASDMIFLDRVNVSRRQVGYIRYSYLSPDSTFTPPRYRCQPDKKKTVAPRFVSKRFGEFGYAQLHIHCPEEIRRGAESESEMGAFHDLFEPQRRARLGSQLEEFTPAELHSRLIFVDERLP